MAAEGVAVGVLVEAGEAAGVLVSMIAFPGQVWTPDYKYTPRWPYGQDGSLKVVSYAAAENISAGVLVQIVPGTETIRIARDANRLVGVSVFDPDHHSPNVVYQLGDMVPVVRRGSAFVAFVALQPPYADPQPLAAARAYVGAGMGQFTTDAGAGTVALTRLVFSIASQDHYVNGDQTAWYVTAPPDQTPAPLGITETTFGGGVALVDVSLP